MRFNACPRTYRTSLEQKLSILLLCACVRWQLRLAAIAPLRSVHATEQKTLSHQSCVHRAVSRSCRPTRMSALLLHGPPCQRMGNLSRGSRHGYTPPHSSSARTLLVLRRSRSPPGRSARCQSSASCPRALVSSFRMTAKTVNTQRCRTAHVQRYHVAALSRGWLHSVGADHVLQVHICMLTGFRSASAHCRRNHRSLLPTRMSES